MKVEILEDEKIVLYLYDYFFDSFKKEEITREVKNLFVRLIKYYHIKIGGIYEVVVYQNEKYGTILEIEKKEELLFNPDLIDIKVKILKDANIYLKTDNYFVFEKYKNVYYAKGSFYINLLEVDNLMEILEFVSFIYKEKDNYLDKMLFIK